MLDSGFQPVLDSSLFLWNVFWISDSLVVFRIPKPRVQDFTSKLFLDSGIRIPLNGATIIFKLFLKLFNFFCINRTFAACHSRGINPPYWRAKVAVGQDKQKAYIIINGDFLCLSFHCGQLSCMSTGTRVNGQTCSNFCFLRLNSPE